jgi:hypothetical protein
LEVDDKYLAVFEEEILRLEIAVNHVGRGGAEALAKSGEGGVVAESFRVFSKMSANVVLEEVILLPVVKWFVENRLEFEVLRWTSVEKCVELLKGGTIEGLAVFVGTVLHREEIGIAQILDEGNLTADIVIKNFWDVQPGGGKEIRDREEVSVVGTFESVVHPDETRMVFGGDPDDGAPGGSLLDRLHENLVSRSEVEVSADGGEKSVGWHREV